jgi:hypothetical protein
VAAVPVGPNLLAARYQLFGQGFLAPYFPDRHHYVVDYRI